jgi:hypothetical protein
MGIQPLNEGIFRKKGKFFDLFKRKKIKNKKGETIGELVPPSEIPEDKYETKYGDLMGAETFVESLSLLSTKQNDKSVTDNATSQTTKTQDYNEYFFDSTIQTTEPRPLPSDPSKKITTKGILIGFQNLMDNDFELYRYFKIIYYIDGVQTDVLSEIQVNQNQTCSTNTLEGKDGNCEFSSEIKDKILNTFEGDTELLSYLNKVQ